MQEGRNESPALNVQIVGSVWKKEETCLVPLWRFDAMVIKGRGHNMWPGWFQCQELVDFVIGHARAKWIGRNGFRQRHSFAFLIYRKGIYEVFDSRDEMDWR